MFKVENISQIFTMLPLQQNSDPKFLKENLFMFSLWFRTAYEF